jgi:hypothetical protein
MMVEFNSFTINTFSNKLVRSRTKKQDMLEGELYSRARIKVGSSWCCGRYDWNYEFEEGVWFFGKYYGNIKVVIYEYKPTPELLKKREERMNELNSLSFPQLVDQTIGTLPKRKKGEKLEIEKLEIVDNTTSSTVKYESKISDIEFLNFMAKYNADMFRPKEKILPCCPNCGANAWEHGNCAYCGTKILI